MYFVYITAVFLFCFLLAKLFIKSRHGYWRRKKAPYIKPKNAFLGQVGEILFNNVPLVNYYKNIYHELSPHKFGGIFNFLTPVLIIRDPELIKNICIKDFSHFMDHNNKPVLKDDPLTLHLFNLQGPQWKTLRTKLMPTFTVAKIKNMFNLVKDCAQELQETINKLITNGESMEMKEMMARYTTDVISSCVFGLKSDSLKNSNSLLRKMGKSISTFNFRTSVVTLMDMISPKLGGKLGLSLFEKGTADRLRSLVASTIKYREESKEIRNDFIDLLMALKKKEILSYKDNDSEETKIEFTDDFVTAQCFSFFLAGFESSSGVLSFALYELAKHQDYQTRLFNEINKILDEDGELSYDSLQKMTYLEQVINEILRMYPTLPTLVRTCNEDYLLDDEVIIEKNTKVVIPIAGLHYDPQYYENPLEFNPENFSKEAIDRRQPYTHLPFGEGPRICIGMRFGLMTVKLGLVTIIKNYAVSLSPKMGGPFKWLKLAITPVVEGGIWLTFNKRF